VIHVARNGGPRTTTRAGRCADPRGAGRLHGDGRPERPRARHAGRLLLPGVVVQPRDAGAAAAGLGLQALRLRRGARFGVHARLDRARRADRARDRAGHLAAAERLEPVLRTPAPPHRHRDVAEPHDRAARAGGHDGHGRGLCRTLRGLRPDGPLPRQCARLGGDDALQDGRGLRDVRQWRPARGAHAGRPGAGPLGHDDLPPRRPPVPGLRAGRASRRARRRRSSPRAGR
jgi:hypothetical protein